MILPLDIVNVPVRYAAQVLTVRPEKMARLPFVPLPWFPVSVS
ncbi:MAG TPA: hypothetical protein VMU80_04495 [Bryobacteraceae bacterium]|nr:hypothetical protein [Bryobacteraceae bacterium]